MRRVLHISTALTAALVLAACGGGGSSDDGGSGGPDEITVGIIPILDVAPLYLGMEEGFFEQRDLRVNVQTAQGGAAIVPGVVSDKFQFGFSNVTSLLLARSEGLPLKVVAPGNYTTGKQGEDFSGVAVLENSDVQDASDLEGKTVAVNTLQNIGDTTVRQSVEKAGGNPDAVKFVEMPLPDMPAALEKGRVDAAWLVEPFRTIVLQSGGREIASNMVDTDPNLLIAAWFTSEQTMQSDPDLAKRFTAAMKESLEYAAQNPEEARAITKEYTDIPPEVHEAMVLPKWDSQLDEQSVEQLAQLAQEDGLVDKPVDTGALLP
jgi:NitT/TauT family transport system substrate-binding protein